MITKLDKSIAGAIICSEDIFSNADVVDCGSTFRIFPGKPLRLYDINGVFDTLRCVKTSVTLGEDGGRFYIEAPYDNCTVEWDEY